MNLIDSDMVLVFFIYLLTIVFGYGLFSRFTALSAKMKMALVGLGGLGHLVGVCGVYVFDRILSPNMPRDALSYFHSTQASLWTGRYGRLSNNLIYGITYWVKHLFSGNSFFATALMFSLTGFLGSVFYVMLFCDINKNAFSIKLTTWRMFFAMSVFMVLPSMLFYTSNIGKDGLVYLCSALVLWSLYKVIAKKMAYLLPLIFSLVLGSLVRSFLPGVLFSAGAIVVIFKHFSIKKPVRSALMLLGLILTSLLLIWAANEHYREGLSLFTKINFFRSYVNSGTTTGIITTQPVLLILLMPYFLLVAWFLPLFGPPHHLFGFIASVENLGMLLLVFWCVYQWRRLILILQKDSFCWFLCCYALIGLSIIGLLFPNLGACMRYKLMFTPSIYIVLLLTVVSQPTKETPPDNQSSIVA